ncbi:hypothetical protein C8J56DRAFT_1072245 [Mycena floridula]|nr:hypothetical protein C8J56DRAFT_1072245 [Mycena floridula]
MSALRKDVLIELTFREKILAQNYSELSCELGAETAQSPASPTAINKLSIDILGHIFVLGFNPDSRYPGIRGENMPNNVSKVCTLWRRAAEATPALWASFSIRTPKSMTDSQITQTALSRWLQNSSTRPLAIGFVGNASWKPAFLVPIMRILEIHSCRLLKIGGTIPTPILSLAMSCPKLQSLSLMGQKNSNANAFPQMLDSCPSLHIFKFNVRSDLYRLPRLPFTQMREIRIHCDTLYVSLADIIDLLQSCINLVHFVLKAKQISNQINTIMIPMLRLPELRTFRFLTEEFEHNSFDAFAILRHLDVPALTVLDIRAPFELMGFPMGLESIVQLINNSQCDLTTLGLHDLQLPQDALRLCLSLTPNLTKLLVSDKCIMNDNTITASRSQLLALLSVSPETPIICSKLTTIDFTFNPDYFDLYALLDFLRSRFTSDLTAQFKEISLDSIFEDVLMEIPAQQIYLLEPVKVGDNMKLGILPRAKPQKDKREIPARSGGDIRFHVVVGTDICTITLYIIRFDVCNV